MRVTRRELVDVARRRGIRVRQADIPFDGLWYAADRLILISQGIDPDSQHYVDVLTHELSHALADDIRETLHGPAALLAAAG